MSKAKCSPLTSSPCAPQQSVLPPTNDQPYGNAYAASQVPAASADDTFASWLLDPAQGPTCKAAAAPPPKPAAPPPTAKDALVGPTQAPATAPGTGAPAVVDPTTVTPNKTVTSGQSVTKDDKGAYTVNNGKSTTAGASVNVAPGSAAVGVNGATSSGEGDAKKDRNLGATAGYNSKTGEATAGVTAGASKGDGASKRGVTGTLAITGDAKGNSGVAAGAGIRVGDQVVSTSVTNGRKAELVKRTLPNHSVVFVVKYELSSGIKVGGEKEGTPGESYGKGANVSGATSHKGERIYANKKDAEKAVKAIQAHGKGGLGKATDLPSAGKVTSDMKVGESREVGGSKGAGVSGSGTAGVAKITVGAGVTKGAKVSIKRTSAKKVEITVTFTKTVDGGGAIEAAGGGAGKRHAKGSGRSYVIEISDISSKKGQKAYAAAVGKVPFTSLPKGGWKRIRNSTTETTTDTTEAKLGPISRTESKVVTNSTTVDAKNNVTKRSKGENTSGAAIAGFGHHSEGNALVGVDRNGKRAWGFKATVDSTSAKSVSNVLGAATGTKGRTDIDGKVSGKYSVDYSLDDKRIQKFVAHMKNVKPDQVAAVSIAGGKTVNGSATKATGVLIAALKRAKNKDEERKALARWVADAGAHAREQLKHYTNIKPTHHVALAGDAHLKGFAGRVALNKKIADLRKKLADSKSDKTQLTHDIVTTLQAQLDKESALSNPKKYKELPPDLRNEEQDRTRTDVAVLRGLLKQARSAAKPKSTTKKDAEPAAPCPPPQSKKPEPDTYKVPVPPTVAQQKAKLQTLTLGMARFRTLVVVHQSELEVSKQVHDFDPTPGLNRTKTLRSGHGAAGVLGIGRGSHYKTYKAAAKHEALGAKHLKAAQAADRAHINIEVPEGKNQLTTSILSAKKIIKHYRDAITAFQRANFQYKQVEEKTKMKYRRTQYFDHRFPGTKQS